MKFQFISALSGFMLALFSVNSIQAQEGGMKKLPDVTVTTTTNVSKKVNDIFKATFPDATNEKWSKLNKDYLVEFITADLNNRVLFHKKGSIIYHIKYGTEKHLPSQVRKLVKSNYDYVDYHITKAINVQEDRRDIWVVNLEDDKKFVIVRVEEGEFIIYHAEVFLKAFLCDFGIRLCLCYHS